MKKSYSKIRHIQESNLILEKRLLSEQTPTPNTNYLAAGTKFCFFGSCRIDIKVIDKTTSQIIVAKGIEGGDVNSLYPQVIKQVQDELDTKKIVGVVLPTLEQLEDTSPKK